MADCVTRSMGIGYPGGSLLLLGLVFASLAAWHRTLGTISVDSVREPRAELFYWITTTFSQTLGTALGDWTADASTFGYLGAAAIFGTILAVLAGLYFWTRVSHVFRRTDLDSAPAGWTPSRRGFQTLDLHLSPKLGPA